MLFLYGYGYEFRPLIYKLVHILAMNPKSSQGIHQATETALLVLSKRVTLTSRTLFHRGHMTRILKPYAPSMYLMSIRVYKVHICANVCVTVIVVL